MSKKASLDTPDGLVTGWATVRNGRIIDVDIESVPAFLYQKDLQVQMDGVGEIAVDIAFNAGFFILCPAKALGLAIVAEQAGQLSKQCLKLRDAARGELNLDEVFVNDKYHGDSFQGKRCRRARRKRMCQSHTRDFLSSLYCGNYSDDITQG